MRFHALRSLILALACLPAHAQVYKCKGPSGNTVYSDTKCSGAPTVVDPAQLNSNRIDSSAGREQTRRDLQRSQQAQHQGGQTQQAQQPGASRASCPTDLQIRNMETSASSRTIGQREREFLQDELRRARACATGGGADTSEDRAHTRDEQRRQQASQQPSAPAQMTRCDTAGCWDSNGQRYTPSGQPGTLYRNDGRICRLVGNMYNCN